MERVVFKSGISLGTGLTTHLQKHAVPGTNITYIDTPGLTDIKRRKEAAEEIAKALRQAAEDDRFKLVFCITLEAGRVRPADFSTISLVRTAKKEMLFHYLTRLFVGPRTDVTARASIRTICSRCLRQSISKGLFHTESSSISAAPLS